MDSFLSYKNEICAENIFHPYTTEVIEKKSNLNNVDLQISKDIILQENPKETIKLDFTLKSNASLNTSSSSYCSSCGNYRNSTPSTTLKAYTLSLLFNNLIHEIQLFKYFYDVKIKAKIQEGNKTRHIYLPTPKHVVREDSYIKYPAKNCYFDISGSASLLHLCFNIRRFKVEESFKEKEKLMMKNDNFELLYNNKLYSNISLVLGDKIFPAHKEIISMKSKVFEKELAKIENGILIINDLDEQVIQEMLYYMYTGKTKIIGEISQELYVAAHRYEIEDLKTMCIENMIFSTNFENIDLIYSFSIFYEMQLLQSNLETLMSKHEEELLTKQNYLNYLSKNISIKNIFYILDLCAKHNLEDVKLAAFQFAKNHSKRLFKDQKMQILIKSFPDFVFEMNKYIHS